jgi:tetratricopeptide (TPR) repeat protein
VSYTEDQLWTLLDQTSAMPYGPGQIALVEQVVEHADALQVRKLAFAARLQATSAYIYGGEQGRSFATFAWCLAEFDRDPLSYQRSQRTLLWHFKHMISALTRFPEVPLDRTYAVLEDMQRRWQETGHSMHAVHAYRHHVASHIGDIEAANHHYAAWCAATRDDLSDCVGCDPSAKAWWLSQRGRDEEAVALAGPVLDGRLTCSEQPQDILATLMVPYVRTGRLDQARDAHRRAYRLQRPNLADLSDIAEHIEFCARTGNEARAVEMVERHLGWLDRAPSPWAGMFFAAASSLALRRAQALLPDELTVFRPGHGERQPERAAAADLAAELRVHATQVAEQFDRRNGTDRVGTLVRGMLDAEPLLEYLPMSPTAARRAGMSIVANAAARETARETPEPTSPGTPAASPVVVPATSGPDELLDLIEDWFEQDRDGDGDAALQAFEVRYGQTDLTVGQRARVVDLQAGRISGAPAGDHAAAAALWQDAAARYHAAGEPMREQRALARAGTALVWSGATEQGLAIVVPATDWLLAHAEPKVRVSAAGRLASCYLRAHRLAETIAMLDRVASIVDEVPAHTRLRHALLRMTALAHGGRADDVIRDAPAVIDGLTSVGQTENAARARVTLASMLEHAGQLTEAADQLAAAIPSLAEPDARAELQLVRASILARTARAAEAVSDLVEAVADRTARGEATAAADARHALATAYLTIDRPLDAAEVAEEELAYRLGVDDANVEPDTAPTALPVRHLLAAIYRRLRQTSDAIAQVDAIAEWYAVAGQRAGIGQMAQQAGEILDEADRDDAAAARFLVAAQICAEIDQPLPELYNRHRTALSLHWAQQREQAVAALHDADAVVPRLDDSRDSRWEIARLHYDASRILWGADQLSEAATRAGRAADAFLAFDAGAAVADSRLQQAKILCNLGEFGPAETAARHGLSALPASRSPQALVDVLDAALRGQGRAGEADRVWNEFGLTRPTPDQ